MDRPTQPIHGMKASAEEARLLECSRAAKVEARRRSVEVRTFLLGHGCDADGEPGESLATQKSRKKPTRRGQHAIHGRNDNGQPGFGGPKRKNTASTGRTDQAHRLISAPLLQMPLSVWSRSAMRALRLSGCPLDVVGRRRRMR